MNLVGMRVADLVPLKSRILKSETRELMDQTGQIIGTWTNDYMDLDGDNAADVWRITQRNLRGKQINGATFIAEPGLFPTHEADTFSDNNLDGVVDFHAYQETAKSSGGAPWGYFGSTFQDRDFDGMTDLMERETISTGVTLDDTDRDGDYDLETRVTLPADPATPKRIEQRKVDIDVAAMD